MIQQYVFSWEVYGALVNSLNVQDDKFEERKIELHWLRAKTEHDWVLYVKILVYYYYHDHY